jgi:sulfur relay protein TusB/DsrH|tara:strand:+ start:360 stop:659 length:300 start_codon:yes stop_codon:yes gene_type:complete
MAILHIIAKHMGQDALSILVERASQSDAYIFIDDGVYVLLSQRFKALNASIHKEDRRVYVMAKHAIERGIPQNNFSEVTLINMADMVRLTSSYSSSISW